jgi:low temperature requirement protein LtrA
MGEAASRTRGHIVVWRPMSGRDPDEEHRTATPLELFFDLAFVVAVASAASELHHAIAEAHVAAGAVGFAVVFFAIWWAWVNFTWFASAYDTDDVPYRLLTMLQMTGVLVFAVGVPAGLGELDLTVMTLGYVVMRVALIAQWLRAARGDPAGRPAALRYAVGVGVVQVGWLLRLGLGSPWDAIVLAVLVVAELLVPVWAEFRGAETAWHPGHIAERYGLFTIIVLGEGILGVTAAISSAIGRGVSASLMLLAVGALLLVFGLWWAYFKHPFADGLRGPLGRTMWWAYRHYLVFGSVAALGAGLEVAVDAAEHGEVSSVVAAWSVAVPVTVYLIVLMRLERRGDAADPSPQLVVGAAVIILITASLATVLGIGIAVLIMGVIVAALVASSVALAGRHGPAPAAAATTDQPVDPS